ncbi:MAG: hypothetical protein LBF33_00885 [Oscillospiraceae bacterium]|jgi:NTP pyrophosphatase (non-canonical NTP hydrolase)|nr:hypothetical protein [Oscillospiraceae bacterium]
MMSMCQKDLIREIAQIKDLGEIQKYVGKMSSIRGFLKRDIRDRMLLLTEEVGELAKAVRGSVTQICVDREKMSGYDTVENEVADVFVVLLSLCNYLKIDLHKAFVEKEKENSKRIWS